MAAQANARVNGILAELIDELEKTRRDLFESAAGLSQEQLDFKADSESWSIGEVLHHLSIVESSIARLLSVGAARASREKIGPPQSDCSVLTALDDLQVEVVRQRVNASQASVPRAGLTRDDLCNHLAGSRRAILDAIKEIATYDLAQLHHLHPALGNLNFYQWILFVAKHERRHMGQIRRSKADTRFSQLVARGSGAL